MEGRSENVNLDGKYSLTCRKFHPCRVVIEIVGTADEFVASDRRTKIRGKSFVALLYFYPPFTHLCIHINILHARNACCRENQGESCIDKFSREEG